MRKIITAVLLGILFLPGIAWAEDPDTISELRKELEQQKQLTEELLTRLDELSRKFEEQEKAREEAVNTAPVAAAYTAQTAEANTAPAAAPVAAPAKAQAEASSWVDRFNLSGDFRYRHETISVEDESTRNRQRIRARVGLDARVSETLDVGIMVASGSDDPISTNQTLDGAFSSKDLRLDLAYFDWHPESVSGLSMTAGKIKNPFLSPGKTELIWDSDLRPEGGAVKYSRTLDDLKLFANLGGFWAEERSSSSDTGLFGAQAGLRYDLPFFNDTAYVLAGGSYFDYGNARGMSPLYDAANSFGNTLDESGKYMYGYELVESFAEFGFKVRELPVSLYGDYIRNTASGVREKQGWLAGATIGKCDSPNSWAFRYNYRDLEADAVLAVFTDSDFIDGGTDGRGHELGFDYQVTRGLAAGMTYFDNQRRLTIEPENYKRLQLDLMFDF